jgi:hypothetical protein
MSSEITRELLQIASVDGMPGWETPCSSSPVRRVRTAVVTRILCRALGM